MASEDVWRLLLQHAWQPLEPEVVCKLLCASQQMRRLVHSTCAGRLNIQVFSHNDQDTTHLQLPRKRAKQLERWLISHQQLVCGLVLQSPLLLGAPDHSSSATAVEPQGRKRSHTIWRLQQRLTWCRQLLASPQGTPGGWVQPGQLNLSAALNHLTRLQWAVSSSSKCGTFIKSLKQLPNLRVLAITRIDSGKGRAALEPLTPALQSLSALTALQLQHFSVSTASSSMLPSSLHTLTLGPPLPRLFQRATRDQHLQLQHLTQLQHLQLHTLKACDLLPVQLTSLEIHLCSVRPLLSLQHLKQLSITGKVPEVVLDQLLELTQLQQLQLGTCNTAEWSPAGSECLQQLPVPRPEAVQLQLGPRSTAAWSPAGTECVQQLPVSRAEAVQQLQLGPCSTAALSPASIQCLQQLPALSVLPAVQLQSESWENGSIASSSTTATGSFSTSSRSGSSTNGSCGSSISASSASVSSSSSTCVPDPLEDLLQQPNPPQNLPAVFFMESAVSHNQELPLLQQAEQQHDHEPRHELHAKTAAGASSAGVSPSLCPCDGSLSAPESDSAKACHTKGAACVSIVVHSE